MIDGTIARKTKTVSEFGSRLDTIADFIFMVVALVKIVPVVTIELWLYIWIGIIALIKIINIISGFVIEKRLVAVHSIMNKVTGLFLFVLPLTLSFIEFKLSAIFVCALGTLAAIQEGHIIRSKRAKTAMTKIINLSKDYFDEVVNFYNQLIDDMSDNPYFPCWRKNIYPDNALLLEMLDKGSFYAYIKESRIAGIICLNESCDPESKCGKWNVDVKEDEVYFIHLLAVSKDFQGQGISKKLIDEAIKIAKENNKKALRLEVSDNNIPAIKLYENKDFVYINDIKVTYSEDASMVFRLYEIVL